MKIHYSLVMLFLIIFIPNVIAPPPGSASDQTLYNQIIAPTASIGDCRDGGSNNNTFGFVPVTAGQNLIIVSGRGDNTAVGDFPRYSIGRVGAINPYYEATWKATLIPNAGEGANDQDLIMHQNLTVSGVTAPFISAVKINVTTSGTLYVSFNPINTATSQRNFNITLSTTNGLLHRGYFTHGSCQGHTAFVVFNASYVPPPPDVPNPPLFGDNGAIVGGNISNLATALFGTANDDAQTAAYFFVGLLLVVGIGGGLGYAIGIFAGCIGALLTMIFLAVIGYWPPWLLVFVGVVVGGLGFLYGKIGGREA